MPSLIYKKERFNRWQSALQNQLSITTNLILGLSTGLLAFQIDSLIEKKWQAYPAFSLALSAILITLGIIISVWGTVVRLRDFRITTKITHDKIHGSAKEEDRTESRELGKSTWNLLCAQLTFFCLGTFTCGIALATEFYSSPLKVLEGN